MFISEDILQVIFHVDGSLRDVYVKDISLEDWQKVLELLLSWKVEFFVDGEVSTNPLCIENIFNIKTHSQVLLSITFKGVKINCHFFDKDVIEFDISPSELTTNDDKHAIFEFMSVLTKILDKEVIIAPENSPNEPFLRIRPDGELYIFN